MVPLEFTEQLVHDHYVRHCELGEDPARLLGIYEDFGGPDLNIRAPDGSGMYALLAWADHTRRHNPKAGAVVDALVDVDELLAHFAERLYLMGAINEAAHHYVQTYGDPRHDYVAGGIVPDTIRIYSVPGYDHALTMPVAWVAAYQTAMAAPGR